MSPADYEEEERKAGSVEDSAEPRFLIIGRIVKPHGVRGELRVSVMTQVPERFTWLERVFYSLDEEDPNPAWLPVETARLHKGQALVKLGGVNNRDAAELMRGYWLMVPEEEAIPLEEGEFFLYQLVGLKVYAEDGEQLGEIVEIVETGANDVLVVAGPDGELLLPDIEEVVRDIDMEAGRMTVHLLPGLRP